MDGANVRRAWLFAGAGAAVWALAWIAPLPNDALPIPRLLMLAMLMVVPLGLALIAPAEQKGLPWKLFLTLHRAQPFAALLAASSFYLPEGILAGALAAPWLLLCAGVALQGLMRIRARGFGGAAETCIDAAMLYLPVGGGWLILSRLGIAPMGFSSTITALTAIHFHYAGFAAPIVAGMAGKQIAARTPQTKTIFAAASVGVISGIALVAAGITFSPLLEVIAALILATSLGTVALMCFGLLGSLPGSLPRLLVGASSAALLIGMVFAGVYAVSEFSGAGVLVIPQMVQYHGMANAAGVILGLIGWGVARGEP